MMISNKNSWGKKITMEIRLPLTLLAQWTIKLDSPRELLYAVGRRTKIELFSNYRCAFSYVQVTRRVNRRRHFLLPSHYIANLPLNQHHLHLHHLHQHNRYRHRHRHRHKHFLYIRQRATYKTTSIQYTWVPITIHRRNSYVCLIKICLQCPFCSVRDLFRIIYHSPKLKSYSLYYRTTLELACMRNIALKLNALF